MWDLAALDKTSKVQWDERNGLVQEIYYAGEPLRGKPTRVFAYLARPAAGPAAPARKYPAMVLVHGGGGQAFKAWAELWAKRGYVAIAMDLSGNGPGKVRDAGGGPPLNNENVFFHADSDEAMRDGWTYHAVAAVIRAHSVLASLPEVDADRIGVTGISWGGYLTCIVAGLDHRLKVAVPVYGCGYLQEDSYWTKDFVDQMTPAQKERWVRLCDPSSYLARVQCPILFINGANDPRFFLDSHRRSYETVPTGLGHLAILIGLKHGHNFAIGEVNRFVDGILAGGSLPPGFDSPRFEKGAALVQLRGPALAEKAEMHYAPAIGPWVERKWTTVPAGLKDGSLSAVLPPGRPVVFYFSLIDTAGLHATSEYTELAP